MFRIVDTTKTLYWSCVAVDGKQEYSTADQTMLMKLG